MATDKKAQKARADRLRAQVKSLVAKRPEDAPATTENTGAPLSPREFIHRKMAEESKKTAEDSPENR